MNRPPRSLKEPLFDRKTIVLSILQGISVLIIVLSIYAIALYQGSGDMEARALSFTTLIVANIGLILTNRSWSRTIFATLRSPNKALWWVIGGAFLFLGLVLYTEPLRNLFGFSVLNLGDLLMCLIAGF